MGSTSSEKSKMELIIPIDIKIACRAQVNHVTSSITPNSHNKMGVDTPVIERITLE